MVRRILSGAAVVAIAAVLFGVAATVAPKPVLAACTFSRFSYDTVPVYFTDSGVQHRAIIGLETFFDGCGNAFWYSYVLVDQSYGGAGTHASAMQALLRIEDGVTGGLIWQGYNYQNPPPADQISIQSPTYARSAFTNGNFYVQTTHSSCCSPAYSYAYNPAWSPSVNSANAVQNGSF